VSRRGALSVVRSPAMERAPRRRLHVVALSVERRVRCQWCLWEATAADTDVEMRLRVMQQAHVETYHPDGPPS
jgi:hypothetical protein